MLAITNSGLARLLRRATVVPLLLALMALGAPAIPPPTDPSVGELRHWTDLRLAALRKELIDTHSASEVRLRLASALFDCGEYAARSEDRERFANEGIALTREIVEIEPRRAAGYYYLAMNQGQLARTKLLGAIHLVDEMEVEFKTALALDPTFDFAGPDRYLGVLYRDAPGWPTSIGNRAKARRHLQAAVDLRPNHPGNRLAFLESALLWSDFNLATREYRALLPLMAGVPENFAGDDWRLTRAEWDRKWADLRVRYRAAGHPLEPPRQRK